MSKQAVSRVLQVFEALARSVRGLDREELRWAIPDYRSASNVSAFERMFERDKAVLRFVGYLDSVVSEDGKRHVYQLKNFDASSLKRQLNSSTFIRPTHALLAWVALVLQEEPVKKEVYSKVGTHPTPTN
ncbi:hypothetical protein [uncultured Rothia sp.]|uniref:hypothetical protein n=1 Tax=uncultured Rothia sp. TaxID=316088 RepID=UPI0032175763